MALRISLYGDKVAAVNLRRPACTQLDILKSQMKHQGLKQSERVLKFDDGTIFKCTSVFGFDQVHIYVPPTGGASLEEPINLTIPTTAVFYVKTSVGNYWVSVNKNLAILSSLDIDNPSIDTIIGENIVLVKTSLPDTEIGKYARTYIVDDTRYVVSLTNILITTDGAEYFSFSDALWQPDKFTGFIYTGSGLLWYGVGSDHSYQFGHVTGIGSPTVSVSVAGSAVDSNSQSYLLPGDIYLDGDIVNWKYVPQDHPANIYSSTKQLDSGSGATISSSFGGTIDFVFFSSDSVDTYQQSQASALENFDDPGWSTQTEESYLQGPSACYYWWDDGYHFNWSTNDWFSQEGSSSTAVNTSFNVSSYKDVDITLCESGSSASGEQNDYGFNSACNSYARIYGQSLDDDKVSYWVFCSNVIQVLSKEQTCFEDLVEQESEDNWSNYCIPEICPPSGQQGTPAGSFGSGFTQMVGWCQLWGDPWVYHTINSPRVASLGDFSCTYEKNSLPDGSYTTNIYLLKILSIGLEYTLHGKAGNVHFLDNRPAGTSIDRFLFAFTDLGVWKVVIDGIEVEQEIKTLLGIADSDIYEFSMV